MSTAPETEAPQRARTASVAFLASEAPQAQAALAELARLYGGVPPDRAAVIVALGGDGFLLETLHRYRDRKVPFYGMNRGSVGFLMNGYAPEGLLERIERAVPVHIHPLTMTALDRDGREHSALAINEVSLLRQRRQAAKIRVMVDDIVRLDELMSDGVLLSTPVGSTAYN
ncbi:MAG: NAD(+)/NADH kinase, partial [Stellaceae bacterium]